MTPDEQVEGGPSAQAAEDAAVVEPEAPPMVADDTAQGALDVTAVTGESPADVAEPPAASHDVSADQPADVAAAVADEPAVPAAVADALDTAAAVAVAPAVAAEAPADAAATEQPAVRRRRVPRPIRAVGRGIAAVAPTVIGIGLLTVGLVGGWQIATTRQANQLANQAPIAPVAALAPAQNPPVVVSEVISAIGADDGNLLAASLPEGPLTQIKNALTGVAHVRRVVPAGTVTAGDQTVTAVQIIAEDASGQLFGIDLLIHTDSTGVVGFR